MKNILLVAQREYTKIVRKPTFWITTLLLPTFIGVVSFISGYSAEQAEKKILEDIASAKEILIIDETGVLKQTIVQPPIQMAQSFDEAYQKVLQAEVDAVIYYPSDLATSHKIIVHAKDTGIMGRGRFNNLAQDLLKRSILLEIKDEQLLALYNSSPTVETKVYANGEEVIFKLEEFVIPGIILVLYFLLSMMSTNFLLLSVSEEKESRMVEILLSIMKSRELIWGKIIGLVGVTLTQLVVLASLSGIILWYTWEKLQIPIDITSITIDPITMVAGLFYLLCGFLIMATIMVGVGAAMPTYREAQSFSSVFIIASIFPIYFVTLIVQEPEGLISRALSYFPFTAPLILLGRNALHALPMWEIILSSFLLVIYVAGGFWIAFKLFDLGSLEYDNKLSFQKLFGKKK